MQNNYRFETPLKRKKSIFKSCVLIVSGMLYVHAKQVYDWCAFGIDMQATNTLVTFKQGEYTWLFVVFTF